MLLAGREKGGRLIGGEGAFGGSCCSGLLDRSDEFRLTGSTRVHMYRAEAYQRWQLKCVCAYVCSCLPALVRLCVLTSRAHKHFERCWCEQARYASRARPAHEHTHTHLHTRLHGGLHYKR